jgi:hypothetical protein
LYLYSCQVLGWTKYTRAPNGQVLRTDLHSMSASVTATYRVLAQILWQRMSEAKSYYSGLRSIQIICMLSRPRILGAFGQVLHCRQPIIFHNTRSYSYKCDDLVRVTGVYQTDAMRTMGYEWSLMVTCVRGAAQVMQSLEPGKDCCNDGWNHRDGTLHVCVCVCVCAHHRIPGSMAQQD